MQSAVSLQVPPIVTSPSTTELHSPGNEMRHCDDRVPTQRAARSPLNRTRPASRLASRSGGQPPYVSPPLAVHPGRHSRCALVERHACWSSQAAVSRRAQ